MPLTFFDAVLLGTLVVLVLLLLGHTLNALVVVVLVRGAVGRASAFYWSLPVSFYSSPRTRMV